VTAAGHLVELPVEGVALHWMLHFRSIDACNDRVWTTNAIRILCVVYK
jgi:hypothetical protein